MPAVCENKKYENLNVRIFHDIKNNVRALTCMTRANNLLLPWPSDFSFKASSNLLRDLLTSVSPSIIVEVKKGDDEGCTACHVR